MATDATNASGDDCGGESCRIAREAADKQRAVADGYARLAADSITPIGFAELRKQLVSLLRANAQLLESLAGLIEIERRYPQCGHQVSDSIAIADTERAGRRHGD